jgi:two-component system response regulator FixJ
MSSTGSDQLPTSNATESDLEEVVYVVDDDPEVREYIQWVLEPVECRLQVYEDAGAFLSEYRDSGPACLITDVCMPGFSGLELQEKLNARGISLPVIVMSAYGTVPDVVRAMRDGALDFLEKPFTADALRERVSTALALSRDTYRRDSERRKTMERLARLTPRQQAVLEGLLAGKPSKIIASELGVSPRTVDVHRFRLMQTMEAQSLPDLFRLVMLARGLESGPESSVSPRPAGAKEESE